MNGIREERISKGPIYYIKFKQNYYKLDVDEDCNVKSVEEFSEKEYHEKNKKVNRGRRPPDGFVKYHYESRLPDSIKSFIINYEK